MFEFLCIPYLTDGDKTYDYEWLPVMAKSERNFVEAVVFLVSEIMEKSF